MINIITSYPKSGNTWMRFIIYEMCFNKENKDNDNSLNIKKYIPDLHILKIENNKLIVNKELKNKEIFLKSHFSYSQMKKFPIKKIISMIPLKLLIVSRALRMKKKWDYHNITEEQLKSKISDIRNEYNINVFVP